MNHHLSLPRNTYFSSFFRSLSHATFNEQRTTLEFLPRVVVKRFLLIRIYETESLLTKQIRKTREEGICISLERNWPYFQADFYSMDAIQVMIIIGLRINSDSTDYGSACATFTVQLVVYRYIYRKSKYTETVILFIKVKLICSMLRRLEAVWLHMMI